MSTAAPRFPNSIEFAQRFLPGMVEIAYQLELQLRRYLEVARPELLAVGERLQRLEEMAPVAGYEDLLIGKWHSPLAARLLALNLVRLGKVRVEEWRTERKLSSAVYRIAKVRDPTPLVISRRARLVVAALENETAMPGLARACVEAGISTVGSFASLAACAAGRDAVACTRLFEACLALKPHVAKPRGRLQSAYDTSNIARHAVLGAHKCVATV
jgi:hypothetical protein